MLYEVLVERVPVPTSSSVVSGQYVTTSGAYFKLTLEVCEANEKHINTMSAEA